MSRKLEFLEQEINHKKAVLKYTERAAEESKRHESLMMLFVDQAERVEAELEKLKRELNETSRKSPKPSTSKAKNEKGKKKA